MHAHHHHRGATVDERYTTHQVDHRPAGSSTRAVVAFALRAATRRCARAAPRVRGTPRNPGVRSAARSVAECRQPPPASIDSPVLGFVSDRERCPRAPVALPAPRSCGEGAFVSNRKCVARAAETISRTTILPHVSSLVSAPLPSRARRTPHNLLERHPGARGAERPVVDCRQPPRNSPPSESTTFVKRIWAC